MSDELQERIRSHSYSPHPIVDGFLDQQRRRSLSSDIDITVRERRPSGVSMSGSEPMDDQTHDHHRCITPARDERTDLQCIICRSLAINPFRCTTIEERNVPEIDFNHNYGEVFHHCCYQCLTQMMDTYKVDQFPCPYCRVNEFYLKNLKCANTHIISESEAYVIDCPNNCGLMGSPVALAHHICPLQARNQSGHTSTSITVHNLHLANRNLNIENSKMRSELAHVVVNNGMQRRLCEEWKNKYKDCVDYCNNTMPILMGHIQVANHTIGHLTADKAERERQIREMMAQNKETKKRYKNNLKKVVKVLTSKIEEKDAKCDRLTREIKELLGISEQNRTQTDSSQTEVLSGVELNHIFASSSQNSQTSEETQTEQ